MNFDKFLSMFDKQWHNDTQNADNISKVYKISEKIYIAYFNKDKSMWLEFDDKKHKRMYRMIYNPKNNMVTFEHWLTKTWKNYDEFKWEFPLSCTEEQFFMNSTIYEGGKYCNIDDMKKVRDMYKKTYNLVHWGRE